MRIETLEARQMLAVTMAVESGNWHDTSTWNNGVPGQTSRAIVSQGTTVTLAGTSHVADEIIVHGQLVAAEGAVNSPDKTLTADWIHVNSGGVFQIGSADDRYDNHGFVLTLTGTNPNADHTVETAMGTMQINNNDGFLMTAMGGRLQFFGEEKLGFSKLAATAPENSAIIQVENVIERNFDGTTSAASDGSLDGSLAWEVGDQIVIASSSNDYADEEVRTITGISARGDTKMLTLNFPLNHRHYGEIEYYRNDELSIDMRAEVALLNRSITIQGTQDTDSSFGNRAKYGTTSGKNLGIGAHTMIMPGSGQITIDGTRFDKMGQTGKLGRYPVHWHVAGNRAGDVLRNSSITNSNNRGVTVHGTQGLLLEGNVLHDIHGHGVFMEDAAEFDNQFISNIVLGIHKVGGSNSNDPFIVPGITRGSNGKVNGEAPRNGNGEGSHDTGSQIDKRFLSSAAYWITNPDNTWVGNISAGSEGTGFWFILPDRVLGLSKDTGSYNGLNPKDTNLGVFDSNTSHTSPVGLTFDRGSDIRGGGTNGYSPSQTAIINDYTAYKHVGTGVYHRGSNTTFDGSKFADVQQGSFNTFTQEEHNILFVGHSKGNPNYTKPVGGYRLYDGPGRIKNAHFAGFTRDNAYTFLNNGGADKYAMTRAQGITFEDDGTADNLQVYVGTNFSRTNTGGRPDAISGIVLDVDGSLTGHAGGGVDHVLVPKSNFYIDNDDPVAPASWNALISNDRFGYLNLDTLDGSGKAPNLNITNGDGGRFRVTSTNTSEHRIYTKLNAGDYTIDFTQAVPSEGFRFRYDVRRGQKPGDHTVFRYKEIGTDYAPTSGNLASSLTALRSASSNTYYRDPDGDLWMKVFEDSFTIEIRPTNDPLPIDEPNIEGVFLVDADSDQDVSLLTEGMVINLAAQSTMRVNFRANADNLTGSVGFELVGRRAFSTSDNNSPYTAFGDSNGDYLSEPLAVSPYSLIATPYSGENLTGTAGPAVTINFDVIETTQSPFGGSARLVADGSRIQAEDFDEGGEGVAYHDTDAGNNGDEYRTDVNVDIGANTDGGSPDHNVGWIRDGEFLEYTVGVTAGAYDISARVASANADPGDLRLLVGDGQTGTDFAELGVFAVESTGGWANWTTLELNDIDLSPYAGSDKVLRLEMDGGSFNLNWLEFAITLGGDYNNDGSVDQSDYTVWRANYGSTTDLAADGNGNDIVDAADYTVWRDNLGAGSSAATSMAASAPISLQASTTVAASETTELLVSMQTRTDGSHATGGGSENPIYATLLARLADELNARIKVFAEYSADEFSESTFSLQAILNLPARLDQGEHAVESTPQLQYVEEDTSTYDVRDDDALGDVWDQVLETWDIGFRV